jgi:hypothetical protein
MFKQEGYDMMGAAFEVYNELGYGMAYRPDPLVFREIVVELNCQRGMASSGSSVSLTATSR